jgi:hypothetical protein
MATRIVPEIIPSRHLFEAVQSLNQSINDPLLRLDRLEFLEAEID